jgi:hypothetical protein
MRLAIAASRIGGMRRAVPPYSLLLRLARDRGLVLPADAPTAADPAPADPDATDTEPADPPGATPDGDPIVQMRAKLQRLAEARGPIPSPDAPPAASGS